MLMVKSLYQHLRRTRTAPPRGAQRKVAAGRCALGCALVLTLMSVAQAAVPTVHGLALYDNPMLPADFDHFPYVNPRAPKGGTLVRSVQGSFDSTNPMIITGTAAAGLKALGSGLVYESLMVHSTDEPFTEYGLIASGIRLDPARRWIEFDIHSDARFSDGVPVTAADVKFSFELLRQQGLPLYRGYYADVLDVTLPNPSTVRFALAENNSRELPLILGQFPILPAHIWRGRDFTRPTLDIPIGSGPYRVTKVSPGSQIEYQRNPEYWGRDRPVNRGRYNPDRIIYDYYRDDSVALEAFLAGQVDYRLETSSSRWMNDYRGPAVARGDIQKITVKRGSPAPMQAWVMNLRNPVFQDKRVREALALAFDFDTVNRLFFYQLYQRTQSFFEDSDMGATGRPQGKELALLRTLGTKIPPAVIDNALPDNTALHRYQRLDKAFHLLQQAGYQIKQQRLVDATGKAFTFELLLSDSGLQRLALPYVQNLARLGIQVRISVIDPAQYQIRLHQHRFDMIHDVFGQSNSPGNEQRYYWTSDYADVPESNNTPGIKNPAIDALVDALIRADTREDLLAATRALDRLLRFNAYVVPLYHAAGYNMALSRRLNRPDLQPRYGVDIESWWLTPSAGETR